jgi:hypothetical protein
MGPENTPATTTDVVKRVPITAVHPTTGELLELEVLELPELADALEEVDEAYGRLADYKRNVTEELARRADALGGRKLDASGIVFEVNAPTEDLYDPADLRRELAPLIEEGVLDAAILDVLIRRPPPKPQPPAVNRAKVKALYGHADRRVGAALARARRRVNARRTVKVLARVEVEQ